MSCVLEDNMRLMQLYDVIVKLIFYHHTLIDIDTLTNKTVNYSNSR